MNDIRQQVTDELENFVLWTDGTPFSNEPTELGYYLKQLDGSDDIMERLTDTVVALVEAHTRQALENFGEFCHEQYTGCQKDDNGQDEYCYRGEVVTMVEQYKALQHPGGKDE